MADRLVYKSKVDAWLAILLGVMVVAYAVIGGAMLILVPKLGMVIGIILLLAAAWVASTLAWTDYTFADGALLVRCGPIKWRIPLGLITDAVPIRSRLSGPALSMDRVQLSYGTGKVINISPADRQDFLAELETRRGALQNA
jgi:hypothetical protein